MYKFKKKYGKNHPHIGYLTQETYGIREAKTKSQEINAGNCESEAHSRTLNATVNRVDISLVNWLHIYFNRTSKVANTIMVTQSKYQNNLPDRKCSNMEKLSPTSVDSWDYKRGRGNRWKKNPFSWLTKNTKMFSCDIWMCNCKLISWKTRQNNYKLCRDISNYTCVSELSFEYFKQSSLKKA